MKVANEEIDAAIESRKAAANLSGQGNNQFRELLRDPTFRRPFFTSLALRTLGLDWSGFFNLGTNLVHIKQQARSNMIEPGRSQEIKYLGARVKNHRFAWRANQ